MYPQEWRHNRLLSEVWDDSEMKVLDDPVTAQYTHTLTVTGRLGGEYQYTVVSNKPSKSTAQL